MTLAYLNDPALKAATLTKIEKHRELDQIVQGYYWNEDEDGVFRGCAVGCLLEDPDGGHERYETEFGIPVQLAWLEDGIFEALEPDDAKEWPLRFMQAILVLLDEAREGKS